MTQEERQVLLKDLGARLLYGVKVHINSPIEEQNSMELFDVNIEGQHIGVGNDKWAFMAIPIIDEEDEAKVVKPYLRPMSSMTDEEKDEYDRLVMCNASWIVDDWLNKNMFDYRELIPMGIALEAKEGMYAQT